MAITAACCNASGGRVVITANGQKWSARTAINIIPLNFERQVVSNQDGSIATMIKPMPAEAELTLSDRCGLNIEDIMACPLDVTLDLIDIKRKYFFSSAVMVGRPTLNSETGEIRGLKITSNDVQSSNY